MSTTNDGGRATRVRRTREAWPAGATPELLDMYIADLSGTATATAEEQKALARRARDRRLSEDERDAARAELVRANLRFAFSIAKQYQHRGVPLEDLVGEANAGLVHAADKYDPDVGVNFISYAVWWIRQSLHAAIAKHGHVVRLPTNRVSDHGKVIRAAEVLRGTLGREPSDEEVARVAGLTAEVTRSLRLLSQPSYSLDEPVNGGSDPGGRTLGETLAAESEEEPREAERTVEAESQQQALARLLDTLGPRDRRVLVMYFGLEGHEPMTLSEIAQVFGVTRERVRQLRDRALERLRSEEAARLQREWAA